MSQLISYFYLHINHLCMHARNGQIKSEALWATCISPFVRTAANTGAHAVNCTLIFLLLVKNVQIQIESKILNETTDDLMSALTFVAIVCVCVFALGIKIGRVKSCFHWILNLNINFEPAHQN